MNDTISKKLIESLKCIVVTGANSGIGYYTALNLSKLNHNVVMVCRNEEKAQIAKSKILKEVPQAKIDVVIGDLSSIKKVTDLAYEIEKKYPTIDVIIHNAGIWPQKRELNEDGLEFSFMVNYLAVFILTKRLLIQLLNSTDPRIVLVSADLYGNGEFDIDVTPYGKKFSRIRTYADSKLCGLLFMKKFQEELTSEEKNKLLINAIHPGVFRTNLGITPSVLGKIIKGVKIIFPSSKKSTKGIINLAVSPDKDTIGTGNYYFKLKRKEFNKKVEDRENQEKLWNFSIKMIQQ